MKIGLLSDLDSTTSKSVINFAYIDFARKLGDVVLIHPWRDNVQPVNLLILPGGQDINPMRYGQPKIPWKCGPQNNNYEYFDTVILPKYIQCKIPIFGICRGLQTLNALFDGTLYQHIEEPYSGENRGSVAHSAIDIRTNEIFGINSLHHQAIDTLGKGFEITLKGIKKLRKGGFRDMHIEAIRHKDLPITAVQFHPEEFDNPKTEKALNWTMREIHSILKE